MTGPRQPLALLSEVVRVQYYTRARVRAHARRHARQLLCTHSTYCFAAQLIKRSASYTSVPMFRLQWRSIAQVVPFPASAGTQAPP